MIDDGFCLDNDPMQLSADLWGYLNVSMAGATDKVAFDNALPGNEFDAWRRIVTPLGTRSEARLHNMHKDVTRPTASRRVADVIHDLEKWESKLPEYYRCGGDKLSDKIKLSLPMTCGQAGPTLALIWRYRRLAPTRS